MEWSLLQVWCQAFDTQEEPRALPLLPILPRQARVLRWSSYLQDWLQPSATEGSPHSESSCLTFPSSNFLPADTLGMKAELRLYRKSWYNHRGNMTSSPCWFAVLEERRIGSGMFRPMIDALVMVHSCCFKPHVSNRRYQRVMRGTHLTTWRDKDW